ncbi:hypothetical protein T492DRAFT_407628 [Pavlovales sp. CCMP2436]|nr:hypothetical protein T492DRAFT_407628 [Pavlovales sp. CCMP2436]
MADESASPADTQQQQQQQSLVPAGGGAPSTLSVLVLHCAGDSRNVLARSISSLDSALTQHLLVRRTCAVPWRCFAVGTRAQPSRHPPLSAKELRSPPPVRLTRNCRAGSAVTRGARRGREGRVRGARGRGWAARSARGPRAGGGCAVGAGWVCCCGGGGRREGGGGRGGGGSVLLLRAASRLRPASRRLGVELGVGPAPR